MTNYKAVHTICNCDPKGEWFSLEFRSSMGGPTTSTKHFMFRENIQALHAALGELLSQTSDGKTRDHSIALKSDEAALAFDKSLRKPFKEIQKGGKTASKNGAPVFTTSDDQPELCVNCGKTRDAHSKTGFCKGLNKQSKGA